MKASDNIFPKVFLSEGEPLAAPPAGVLVLYVKDDGKIYAKNSTGAEVELGAGAGIPDAPSDGAMYGRRDGSWAQVEGGDGAAVVLLPGSNYTLSQLTPGAWHVFTSAAPVTINVENDSVEPVPVNAEYGLECRSAAGVTISIGGSASIIPPKGGTLELEQDDFAVLKRTASDEYKLAGSTVDA